jgi:Na+-transporting NADH:ubiquinone oxidoreductase subunit NqrC
MLNKKQKGQVSIEFIVILGVILLFCSYFTSTVYYTLQTNQNVYLVKQNLLTQISENNYPTTISKITPNYFEGVLYYQIDLKKNNGPPRAIAEETILDINKYKPTIDYLVSTTNYEDVVLVFTYE